MLPTLLVSALLVSPAMAPIAALEKAALKKEFDQLWADLGKHEPDSTRAAIRLYARGKEVIPLIKSKMRPLKLDADACNDLIKQLGSDDEETWRAAWNELDYLDPRLAIDLQVLMNTVKENPAHSRLVEVMSQQKISSLSGETITLRSIGKEGYNFFSKDRSWWAEHRVERIGGTLWTTKKAWIPCFRAIAVLQELGTPDALAILEDFATGHTDAAPTKAAFTAVKALKAK